MPAQRTLSWNSALRGLRADRVVSAEDRRAHVIATSAIKMAAGHAARSAHTAPLVVAGRYDRRAIMAAAVHAAQLRRQVTGDAWSVCLSYALKGAWQVAKSARRVSAH